MRGKKIGIYNPYIETRGGGEKVTAVLAEQLSKHNEVTLIVWKTKEPINLLELEEYFSVDLSRVKVEELKPHSFLFRFLTTHRIPWPQRFRQIWASYSDFKKMEKMGFDVFVNNLYQNTSPNIAPYGVYMCMFPQKLTVKRTKRGIVYTIYSHVINALENTLLGSKRTAIDSYNLITANSKFTQHWIKQYWGSESRVLYPVCENMYQPGVKKKKIILNVGRFFVLNEENHHKRQDVLLEAFSKMKTAHEDGWELHFAGSTAADADSLKFCISLTQKAEGLPVFFHFDYPFEKLRHLYNEASIYWHATGYGFDEQKYPEKQEHFGITTVEAMSAGAVPVGINSAGQKESIVDEVSGYLWDTPEQLISKTMLLTEGSIKVQEMRKKARLASKSFDKQAFNKRVDELFKLG